MTKSITIKAGEEVNERLYIKKDDRMQWEFTASCQVSFCARFMAGEHSGQSEAAAAASGGGRSGSVGGASSASSASGASGGAGGEDFGAGGASSSSSLVVHDLPAASQGEGCMEAPTNGTLILTWENKHHWFQEAQVCVYE
jgi:hypothetical protein